MNNEITNISLVDLPFFIIFKIASYLRDTTSYNNFRSSCKSIYECIHYVRSFYECGALRSSVKIYQHIPRSDKEVFYMCGKLQKRYTLRGFKYHGPCREFYEDGTQKTICSFYLNKKDGPYLQYHHNGVLSKLEQYYRGKCDGKTFTYYDNGTPKTEINYKNGEKHDVYREYLSTGELIVEKKYKNGKLHGLYREWASGIVTILACYIYGKLENRWEEYYVDGGLCVRRNYLDGRQHGNEINYYVNGKIKTIKRFVLGKQHDIEKGYYRDGTLKYVESWKHGSKHGIAVYYSHHDGTTKTVDYFYNSIMYSCVENRVSTCNKLEEYQTSFGKIKIQTLFNFKTLCINTSNFSYEHEVVHDNNTEYTRFYFSELKDNDKETILELMVFTDSDTSVIAKTLNINNKYSIRKSQNTVYYTIKT